jgi:hypothetical protein
MSKYYGHHPTRTIANPETIDAELEDRYTKAETDTLTEEASGYAYDKSVNYTNTLVENVSAATLEQANNGWWKYNFTMTTTTTAASGRPIGIIFDEHTVFFKVHIAAVEFGAVPSGDSGAWHLEAAFYKSLPFNGMQVGSTIVVFNEKTNPNWDAYFQLMGISDEVVEIAVYGDGQDVRWTVTVEWLLGAPF